MLILTSVVLQLGGRVAGRRRDARKQSTRLVAFALCVGACGEGSLDCETMPLTLDEGSPFGYTAQEVVDAVSGGYVGTLTEGDARFWQILDEAPATPLALEFTLDYADGPVLQSSCTEGLEVQVVVEARLAGEAVVGSTPATLLGGPEGAHTEWTQASETQAPRPVRLRFDHEGTGDRLYLTVGDGLGAADIMRQP